ncbi:MAG: adenylyl-sulfate kinase [Bacteroidetes bacterium]|nr:MAG: adenylyl-sulfate kinase [Bacteroidota bacterium]
MTQKRPQNPWLSNPFVTRGEKETILKQKAKVIWMTGLSGSGKTTLAIDIEKRLAEKGILTQVFDADIIRATINRDLDFSLEGRLQNIHRVAHLSRIFLEAGIVVINCFISPTRHIRHLAKKIIGPEDYIEVFVNAPLDLCEKRDPKGLYKKARNNQLPDFTGIDSPYEPPEKPDFELNTEIFSKNELVNQFVGFILPIITNQQST